MKSNTLYVELNSDIKIVSIMLQYPIMLAQKANFIYTFPTISNKAGGI